MKKILASHHFGVLTIMPTPDLSSTSEWQQSFNWLLLHQVNVWTKVSGAYEDWNHHPRIQVAEGVIAGRY